MGRLDEARRHCDIAEGLLQRSTNVWLSASCLINRGCIAWLTCHLDEASDLFRVAREKASRSGHGYLIQATDTCIGYTHMLMGEFAKAEQTYLAASRDATADIGSRLSSLGGLARVHLASGRIDEAQRVIDEITERLGRTECAGLIYHVRWAAITQARLLINKGRHNEAIALLNVAEEQSRAHRETPLIASVHLTHALVPWIGDF